MQKWNKADAQLFGYKEQFPYGKMYFTNKLVGYIKFPNGNHKILLRINNKKFIRDAKRYLQEYNRINSIRGELVLMGSINMYFLVLYGTIGILKYFR